MQFWNYTEWLKTWRSLRDSRSRACISLMIRRRTRLRYGRDAEHAVVAVTTGLLDILNKTEVGGVLALELSHIGNRDMLVSRRCRARGIRRASFRFFLRGMMWGGGKEP